MGSATGKVNGKDKSQKSDPAPSAPGGPAAGGARLADGIYQQDRTKQYRVVGRVSDPEIDEEGKEVRFGEINQTDDLSLPEECEFQKYVLIVRRIAYARQSSPEAPQKGRVLRGVVAEIVGYREN